MTYTEYPSFPLLAVFTSLVTVAQIRAVIKKGLQNKAATSVISAIDTLFAPSLSWQFQRQTSVALML